MLYLMHLGAAMSRAQVTIGLARHQTYFLLVWLHVKPSWTYKSILRLYGSIYMNYS
jgi:hypothetical protein